MPDCTIVIPLFDQVGYTQRCLETLIAHTPEDRYEVVLVDNGSTDGTGQLLDQLEGDVTIIRNERNRGFAVACNQGAEAASTGTLVFLNNDVELLPGWLDPLLDTFDADPSVGAVGAKLLFPDGTIQHAGVDLVDDGRIGALHALHRWRGGASHEPEANRPGPVPAVTAALVAVDRAAFDHVGGFDTGYWNGLEDVDLCLALWGAGRRVLYEPRSTAIHRESASGDERWAKVTENIRRFDARWHGRARPTVVVTADGVATRPAGAIPPVLPVRSAVA